MKNMPRETMLVIGGCRSGKSSFAEKWAAGRFTKKILVATMVPGDDEELRRRVAMHRQNRSPEWRTIEEPYAVARVLRQEWQYTELFVVDCLTLWLTNLMLTGLTDEQVLARVDDLADAVTECPVCVVLVANEVGLGIVPESDLARRFRDLAGWCNQRMAARCDQVVFMAAGLPLYLKQKQK